MSTSNDPIASMVSEIKGNTGFISKLLFPRISILLGIAGFLIALVLILK